MNERIIWLDRSGVRVDGGEPETTRYVREDVYTIVAEAILMILMEETSDPVETARDAAERVNQIR